MKFSVQHDNPAFEQRIRYVFDFIQHHPLSDGKVSFDLNEKSVGFKKIAYLFNKEKAQNCDYFIPAQRLFIEWSDLRFGQASGQDLSSLYGNGYPFQGFQLLSVERQIRQPNPFFQDGTFSFDLIETIFFHVSRLEEHRCADEQKDIHGRMKATEQFLVKNKSEKIPVVDYLVYCFLEALGASPLRLQTIRRLSYDVDIMHRFSGFPPLRSTLKYVLTRPKSLFPLWKQYFLTKTGRVQDPYFNFDWMLQTLPSTEQVIYFLSGGNTRFDRPFPLLDNDFKNVVMLAKEQGFRIGIHPSYSCWDSLPLAQKEKEWLEDILKREITLSRQHFLHFSMEKTPDILERLGIQEDSTLGFSDRIGFRCGTGFSYKLYNFKEERPWQFYETPMVLMDVALMREARNNWQQATKIWMDFLNANSYLTYLTFNFHNSRFFDAELEGVHLRQLFEDLR